MRKRIFADIHCKKKNMDCPSIIRSYSGNQTKISIFYSLGIKSKVVIIYVHSYGKERKRLTDRTLEHMSILHHVVKSIVSLNSERGCSALNVAKAHFLHTGKHKNCCFWRILIQIDTKLYPVIPIINVNNYFFSFLFCLSFIFSCKFVDDNIVEGSWNLIFTLFSPL